MCKSRLIKRWDSCAVCVIIGHIWPHWKWVQCHAEDWFLRKGTRWNRMEVLITQQQDVASQKRSWHASGVLPSLQPSTIPLSVLNVQHLQGGGVWRCWPAHAMCFHPFWTSPQGLTSVTLLRLLVHMESNDYKPPYAGHVLYIGWQWRYSSAK